MWDGVFVAATAVVWIGVMVAAALATGQSVWATLFFGLAPRPSGVPPFGWVPPFEGGPGEPLPVMGFWARVKAMMHW